MESYIMKPSQSYVSVNVPVDRSSTAVSLEAMDPDSSVREDKGWVTGNAFVIVATSCKHHPIYSRYIE